MSDLDAAAMRRLAFIKYLLKIGLEQSHHPNPMGASSILNFHDSVELFLALAAEHLGASVQRSTTFTQYWDLLDPLLDTQKLSQQASMRRLNAARGNLKHQGILPDEREIEAFRVNVSDFFTDNTPVVFGMSFDAISMVDLVEYEEVRHHLNKANEFLQENDADKAIAHAALALDSLIHEYERSKRTRFGRSVFYFGHVLGVDTFPSGFDMSSRMGRFCEQVKTSIESMQEAIKMLALGIDYRRYARFQALTPHVYRTIGGVQTVMTRGQSVSAEDCRYCHDFVIETAVHLQSFDYEVQATW